MVSGRQIGKSTTLAVIAILYALTHARSRIYCVAPDYKQGANLARIIGNYLYTICPPMGQDKIFKFPNQSTITMRSADSPVSLRGDTLDLVLIDEAAHLKKEVYYDCLVPATIVKNGKTMLFSTPNGHNWLKELWDNTAGNTNWFRLNVPSSISPLISTAELEEKRAITPKAKFNQEYGGQFVAKSEAIFDPEDLDAEVIFCKQMPEQFNRGIISVDLSAGDLHSDFQAVVFVGWMDKTLWVDATVERMPVQSLLHTIKYIYEKYKPDTGVVFETNFGQMIAPQQFSSLFTGIPPQIHTCANTVKKETRIMRLSTYLKRREIKVLNNAGGRELVNELRDFPSKDEDVHDDAADALELAIRTLVSTSK